MNNEAGHLCAAGDTDPARFNPDRLMTPEGQKTGQLMPFGAGARSVTRGGGGGPE
jgi:hypothetical protein